MILKLLVKLSSGLKIIRLANAKRQQQARRKARQAQVKDDPAAAFSDLFGEPDGVSDSAAAYTKSAHLRSERAANPLDKNH